MACDHDYDDDSLDDIRATRDRGRPARIVKSRREYETEARGLVRVPSGNPSVTISGHINPLGSAVKV